MRLAHPKMFQSLSIVVFKCLSWNLIKNSKFNQKIWSHSEDKSNMKIGFQWKGINNTQKKRKVSLETRSTNIEILGPCYGNLACGPSLRGSFFEKHDLLWKKWTNWRWFWCCLDITEPDMLPKNKELELKMDWLAWRLT